MANYWCHCQIRLLQYSVLSACYIFYLCPSNYCLLFLSDPCSFVLFVHLTFLNVYHHSSMDSASPALNSPIDFILFVNKPLKPSCRLNYHFWILSKNKHQTILWLVQIIISRDDCIHHDVCIQVFIHFNNGFLWKNVFLDIT